MLSRSSSSSISRRTYSLSAAARPCSHASCAFVLLAIRLTLLFLASCAELIPAPRPRNPRSDRLKGRLEDLRDAIHEHEFEVLSLVLGDLGHITAVSLRHDHSLDPGALGGERLLLQATDRQHLARERDLSR